MAQNYFISGLNVRGRSCWVIGNDEEAIEKSERLVKDGAEVTLVAPSLRNGDQETLKNFGIHWKKKKFELSDVNDQFYIVFCDKNDSETAKKLYDVCRKNRILLCTIDQPQYCDVVNVSTYERGYLKIGVSTGGVSPASAKKIRQGLESDLKNIPLETFFESLKNLREKLEREIPDVAERRKKLIAAVSDFEFKSEVKLPKEWMHIK